MKIGVVGCGMIHKKEEYNKDENVHRYEVREI